MPTQATAYRGRFAPSPTGPLHLGSLIAALASYLDARHHGGSWLVRMEDIDPPRAEPGAAQRILNSLQAHGLIADEAVLYQSSRSDAYQRALDTLFTDGMLFSCDCTRALTGPNGSCHGRCRERHASVGTPCALRVNVPSDYTVTFRDRLQGLHSEALGQSLSDFVVKRKDGLDAYQLAVVVDDGDQGITHIVRGCDLLDSTPRQILLQELLGYATPNYCHLPVITTRDGQKFSKQNQAPPLNDSLAAGNLRLALRFLHQLEPPAELQQPDALLRFAVEHWSLQQVPAQASVPAATLGLDA
ncbi:MAG: tRNA glutamyl-Q(34) synthetase GluQRS [Halioglobus sp.]